MSNPRQLTPKEKREYDRMIKFAKQLSLGDLTGDDEKEKEPPHKQEGKEGKK